MHNNRRHYKIGTRGSLLALTQCTQIKDELERVTGDSFELVIIKTQGDIQTEKPLWQMDGKDFFTKELDEALMSGKVDLVVHSYKDLGSERPNGITLAAITKRTFPHDILLIKKEVASSLMSRDRLIVGTSSPRRITNLTKDLSEFLPGDGTIKIETRMLRGNVNTRIQKLQNGEYDAITLALPGLERLAIGGPSKKELTELLKGLTFKVLPLSHFPSAASQGALAIECYENRDDSGLLKSKLALVDHADTREEVMREREAFKSYGGGCHLAVGINVKKMGPFFLHIHRGKTDIEIKQQRLESPYRPTPPSGPVFVGLPKSKLDENELEFFVTDEIVKKETLIPNREIPAANFFVTSTNTLDGFRKLYREGAVWSAGSMTHKKLSREGYWVNGCADSRGHDEISLLRSSKALMLMNPLEDWYVLTNDSSLSEIGETIPCYERGLVEISEEQKEKIRKCEIFYWTSFFQYLTYKNLFPEIADKINCCGIGKTWESFEKQSIPVIPFITFLEFKHWIGKRT